MKLWPTSVRAVSLAAALVFAASGASAQEGDLAAARELYASASYDDALTVLNKLRSSDHPASQARAIEQYRAFCLLALGRAADAQEAIEAVVAAEPTYQPTEGDVSPRIRTAFADVRRRMLPAIIQQKYAQAKAAYDKKAFAMAAEGFSQVLVALTDPAVSSDANKPPLSDLRTLAVGFEELAAKAAAPPPPPPPPPANVPPTVAITGPANNATFTKKASITTTATAGDADGTVARVEFLRNGSLVATDTTSPYSWTWSSATPGTHTITARAVDNAGASASATVTITVRPK